MNCDDTGIFNHWCIVQGVHNMDLISKAMDTYSNSAATSQRPHSLEVDLVARRVKHPIVMWDFTKAVSCPRTNITISDLNGFYAQFSGLRSDHPLHDLWHTNTGDTPRFWVCFVMLGPLGNRICSVRSFQLGNYSLPMWALERADFPPWFTHHCTSACKSKAEM